MKQAHVDPARIDPRTPAAAVLPLRAEAFALPAQRLRELTRAELKAGTPTPHESAPQPTPDQDETP